jgi:hypothetical protein
MIATRGVGLFAIGLLACARLHGGVAEPHIERIVPDSVVVQPGSVIQVVIRGNGFVAGTPGQNIVRFGEISIPDVPANDGGTEIRFVVPDRMPLRGDAAPAYIESGRYPVRVVNAAGASNVVNMRIGR